MNCYDLRCTPQGLRYAAEWASCTTRLADITLTTAGDRLIVCHDGGRTSVPGGRPGRPGRVEITQEQLLAAAVWVVTGRSIADVTLLADDRMLLVGQGDDMTGFDTGGEPASAEYLGLAPLDRPDKGTVTSRPGDGSRRLTAPDGVCWAVPSPRRPRLRQGRGAITGGRTARRRPGALNDAQADDREVAGDFPAPAQPIVDEGGR